MKVQQRTTHCAESSMGAGPQVESERDRQQPQSRQEMKRGDPPDTKKRQQQGVAMAATTSRVPRETRRDVATKPAVRCLAAVPAHTPQRKHASPYAATRPRQYTRATMQPRQPRPRST